MASRGRTSLDPQEASARSAQSTEPRTEPIPTDELLDLLGDEYARRVLKSIAEKPRTGNEVIEAAGISKATVYRRLNRLEEAGLVETTTRIDTDGHHCKQFHAVIGRLAIDFDDSGYDASVQVQSSGRSGDTGRSTANSYLGADD